MMNKSVFVIVILSLLLAFSVSGSTASLRDGLISCYDFGNDPSEGVLVDVFSGIYNGTVVNSLGFENSSGIFGNSWRFKGTNGYVNFTGLASKIGNQSFSHAFWLDTATTSNTVVWESIDTTKHLIQVESGGNWFLQETAGGQNRLTHTFDFTSSTSYNLFSYTFNETDRLLKAYANSTLKASKTDYELYYGTETDIVFGSRSGSAAVEAIFDEMCLWNRTLISSEIGEFAEFSEHFGVSALFTFFSVNLFDPPDNSNFNENFTFNFSLRDVVGTANCSLLENGLVDQSLTSLSDGNHSFDFDAFNKSETSSFLVSCTDASQSQNSTALTIRVDSVYPQILSFKPVVDNSTKVDKQIVLNISMRNDALNHTFVNITGQGDAFFNETFNLNSTVNYTSTINVSSWTEGNKSVSLFASDDLHQNFLFLSFEVCHANWTCAGFGSCNATDQAPCTSAIDLKCGYNSTEFDGNFSEFAPLSCNFCTSTFDSNESSCVTQLTNITYFFTDTCCADTNLSSDCDVLPANETVSCSLFDYPDGSDLTAASIDTIGKILAGLSAIAALLAIGLAVAWSIKRLRAK